MAQRKTPEKRRALVEAAVAIFAARGFWDTPTALISKTAGVADGTLFTYFKTKDELIHAVYIEIKKELADASLEGLSAHTSIHDKMRHLWNCYIEWGLHHPDKFKVLQQIGDSYPLDEQVKAAVSEPFVELEQMARESIEKGEMRNYPRAYLVAFLNNQAIMTIRFLTTSQD